MTDHVTEPIKITISELINSWYFEEGIRRKMRPIIEQKDNRPAPKPGMKYRRTVIDQFDDSELNCQAMQREYVLIIHKKSALPKQKRNFIKSVCDEVLKSLIDQINEHNASIPKSNPA
jgi:hypothetical protein